MYTKISLTVLFSSLLQTGAARYRASREGLSDGGAHVASVVQTER